MKLIVHILKLCHAEYQALFEKYLPKPMCWATVLVLNNITEANQNSEHFSG